MDVERIDPSVVRDHVIEQLASLPHGEHLAALRAIVDGDVELDLIGPVTIGVELAGRWRFEVPAILRTSH